MSTSYLVVVSPLVVLTALMGGFVAVMYTKKALPSLNICYTSIIRAVTRTRIPEGDDVSDYVLIASGIVLVAVSGVLTRVWWGVLLYRSIDAGCGIDSILAGCGDLTVQMLWFACPLLAIKLLGYSMHIAMTGNPAIPSWLRVRRVTMAFVGSWALMSWGLLWVLSV